jgi:hypothetical protein
MRFGQSALEFVLVCAVVLSIAAGVLVPMLREAELGQAIAAARAAAFQYAASNSSLALTSVEYSISGSKVSLRPNVYFGGSRVSPPQLRSQVLRGVASVFNPGSSAGECVNAVYYSYCVE